MRYDYKAKDRNLAQLNNYMLAKTLTMFEWQNLPETIPQRELEKLLQVHGFAFITEVKGVLYAFVGGLGGEVDVYGNFTTITINNVALSFNKTLSLNDDGVLIVNDDMMMGLLPLYNKHHAMMVENDINMVLFGYNTRMKTLISASDDKTKQSAENYIEKTIKGDLGVIGDNAMFDGVRSQSTSSQGAISISSLIEYQQYIKGTLYNEVGLSANFNMKKERLISAEVEQGEDSLFPFAYNLMKCRLNAIELLNERYGLSVNVDFGSVWHFKNRDFVDGVVSDTNDSLPSELDTVKDNSDDTDQSNPANETPINQGGLEDTTEDNATNATEDNPEDTTEAIAVIDSETSDNITEDTSEDTTEQIEVATIVNEIENAVHDDTVNEIEVVTEIVEDVIHD